MIESEPPNAPCPACSSGPVGFAGHADLRAQTLGDFHMSLRCRRCESLWSRTLEQEGIFTWSAITERMSLSPRVGIRVPPPAPEATPP